MATTEYMLTAFNCCHTDGTNIGLGLYIASHLLEYIVPPLFTWMIDCSWVFRPNYSTHLGPAIYSGLIIIIMAQRKPLDFYHSNSVNMYLYTYIRTGHLRECTCMYELNNTLPFTYEACLYVLKCTWASKL